MANQKIKILRCTKIEFIGVKNKKEEIIATIEKKNNQLIVESKNSKIKTDLKILLETYKKEGAGLLWSKEKDGFHQDLMSFQKPEDRFFLEAIISSWGFPLSFRKNLWGYDYVWVRKAGKIREEEISEELLASK